MDDAALVSQIKQTLQQYQPSPVARAVLQQAKIILLVGITGAGRNTIIEDLLETGQFHYIVSHTTRQPRVNNGVPEREGVQYHFVDNATLLQLLKTGEFVEAKFIHNQQFSGTSIEEIEHAVAEKKIAITDIEVQGVREYMQLKPDTKAVFVLPPSYEQWLERLKKRGETKLPELTRRFASAAVEIETALSEPYYHFVINDDLAKSVTEIKNLALEDKISTSDDTAARKLAQALLRRLKEQPTDHN